MKEKLYRGKRIDVNQWVYGELLCNQTKHSYKIRVNDRNSENYGACYEVYPLSVGEFSGFYDKNGTKVFHMDIIKYVANDGTELEDVYVDIDDFLGVTGGLVKYGAIIRVTKEFCELCEIIGNYYDDTKELL